MADTKVALCLVIPRHSCHSKWANLHQLYNSIKKYNCLGGDIMRHYVNVLSQLLATV